jgi:hypothetical protein
MQHYVEYRPVMVVRSRVLVGNGVAQRGVARVRPGHAKSSSGKVLRSKAVQCEIWSRVKPSGVLCSTGAAELGVLSRRVGMAQRCKAAQSYGKAQSCVVQ